MSKFIQEILEKYEFDSVHELLFELIPKGYNIPSAFVNINEVSLYPAKSQVTIFGYIDNYEIIPTNSSSLSRIKAKIYKDGESATLYWNVAKPKAKGMVFGLKQRSKDNALVQVTGKIAEFDLPNGFKFKYIDQPQVYRIDHTEGQLNSENELTVLMPEPMYRLKEGIKLSQIQLAFKEILDTFDSMDKTDFMPVELEKILKMQPLNKSIRYCHGLIPVNSEKFHDFLAYEGFKKRLLIEKIWTIMNEGFKNRKISDNPNFILNDHDISNIKDVLNKLPFEITNDQRKAVWGLLKHYELKAGSKNLVFGDVGSGKTMVALIVAYVLMKRGYQVAIMTPTSILAKQHYEEAIELFPDNHIFIVHSKTTKKEKDKINSILEKGEGSIVYGTSSLNGMSFTNLGLVVVDEEQKFGVKDKEVLYKKSNEQAHLVLMTATPIPRTLAGAMFSDFNIQKIEQKPAMQKPRITKLVSLKDLPKQEIEDIKERMRGGELTLVIVPSIVSNDLISVSAAKEKYAAYFPEFKIDSIHGRMKPQNIEETTELFMQGKVNILIATTMVDAGFSHKLLSHVFIENADRFGIAQLHQIRGRVGRGKHQGYCYLSPASEIHSLKEATRTRLNSLVESENGFELSMKDISLRGSGDLLGTQQSGSDVNLIEWIKEVEIMSEYIKSC